MVGGRTSMNPRTAFLCCAVLVITGASVQAGPPDVVQIHAGGFEVTLIDGTRVPISSILPAGRPAVVEFWATWCPPCRKSTRSLQELFERYDSRDLAVVGLTTENFDSDRGKVEQFVSEQGLTFPIAYVSKELFQFMNEREEVGVPKILIYERNGKVVEHIISYSPLTARRVARAVARAVDEK
jgi:thiol-disulfide isomerase/thioredoxin